MLVKIKEKIFEITAKMELFLPINLISRAIRNMETKLKATKLNKKLRVAKNAGLTMEFVALVLAVVSYVVAVV